MSLQRRANHTLLLCLAFLITGIARSQTLNAADTLLSEAWDGSFAVVARTAIGPIYIGGVAGDNDHRKWWFGLGHVF